MTNVYRTALHEGRHAAMAEAVGAPVERVEVWLSGAGRTTYTSALYEYTLFGRGGLWDFAWDTGSFYVCQEMARHIAICLAPTSGDVPLSAAGGGDAQDLRQLKELWRGLASCARGPRILPWPWLFELTSRSVRIWIRAPRALIAAHYMAAHLAQHRVLTRSPWLNLWGRPEAAVFHTPPPLFRPLPKPLGSGRRDHPLWTLMERNHRAQQYRG